MLTKTLFASFVIAFVAATIVAGSTAAADTKAPRIVSAAMKDADGDFRADRLRLTYSERVRHAADADGRYPFRIAGYSVRVVGAASGKTILLALVERTAPDDASRPAVAYRRTAAKPVRDRAGNQAVGQVFRAVREHGHRAPVTTPPPSGSPPTKDRDGDGVADAQDCAPDDPAIKPGATDKPDLAFVDSNCDGIDGTERNAIFASPRGKDTNSGTKSKPKRQIEAAVAAAKPAGKDVYAAAGAYQAVTAATGVGIYGGYVPDSWARRLAFETRIEGTAQGIYADGSTGIVLQNLVVVGNAGVETGASAYGIRLLNSSSMRLQRVLVSASNGRPGDARTSGLAGAAGDAGGNGGIGSCDGSAYGLGGEGGASQAGRPGGRGGNGGQEGFHRGDPGAPGEIDTSGGGFGAPRKRRLPGPVTAEQPAPLACPATEGVAVAAEPANTDCSSTTARATAAEEAEAQEKAAPAARAADRAAARSASTSTTRVSPSPTPAASCPAPTAPPAAPAVRAASAAPAAPTAWARCTARTRSATAATAATAATVALGARAAAAPAATPSASS